MISAAVLSGHSHSARYPTAGAVEHHRAVMHFLVVQQIEFVAASHDGSSCWKCDCALFFTSDLGFLWYNVVGCGIVVATSALLQPILGTRKSSA